MKTFITQKQNWKHIALAALTLSIAAPFATSVARADDDDDRNEERLERLEKRNEKLRERNERLRNRNNNNAPYVNENYNDPYSVGAYAYGDSYYGDTNTREFRDTNRNGIDDRYENGRGGIVSTVTGVVTRDLRGRRFEISANNRTYVVIARNNEPLRLTVGDRVTVLGRLFQNVRTNRNNGKGRGNGRANGNGRGNINNAFILADRIRITRNDDQNQNGSRVNFTGRVEDVRSQRELVVRTSDGRTLRVRTAFNLSTQIDDGDRVRVTGRLQNNSVDATRVELVNNSNDNDDDFYDDDNSGNNDIDFKGRVESSTNILGIRIITVRADNGTRYRVRSSENTTFRNGERVRVRGDVRSGVVFANDIDRI